MSKRTKRVSPRQLEANRRNAQKSTGPKTQAGIDHSKFNALRHGLTAFDVCIPGEEQSDYDARRQQYLDYFQPANLVEFDLVDDLVASIWRKNRIIRQEAILIEVELQRRQIEKPDPTLGQCSLDVEAALATQALANNCDSLRLLDRYESRISRNIFRTLKALRDIQRDRPPADGPMPVYPPVGEQLPAPAPDPLEPAPASATEDSPIEAIPKNGHLRRTPNRVVSILAARPLPETETTVRTPFTDLPDLFRVAGSGS